MLLAAQWCGWEGEAYCSCQKKDIQIHPKLPLKQMSIFAHGKLTLFMEKEKISQAFISDHMTVFINGFI